MLYVQIIESKVYIKREETFQCFNDLSLKNLEEKQTSEPTE